MTYATTSTIDEHAATELQLFIDNDYPTYLYCQSIARMLTKRIDNGTYDHTKAPQAWSNVVARAAKRYCDDFGGQVRYTFPKALRQHVAQVMADDFRDNPEQYG